MMPQPLTGILRAWPGEIVRQGQALGRAPFCIHFEGLRNGRLEDPEAVVSLPKRPVRRVIKE